MCIWLSHSQSCTYLKGDKVVTSDCGSKRKRSWETNPVVVFTVTTGKPICSTQVFMMSWTEAGSVILLALTACRVRH